MFYVKERLDDSIELSIAITDENVFCHCPKCDAEVSVDIGEILSDGESDLFGTAVFCKACSENIMTGGKSYEHK